MSQTEQTIEGIGILVAAFPEEQSGEKALKVLKEAKDLHYVNFDNVALVRQDAEGGVHYHETGDMSTGKGSGIGALIGGVIGILGGPLGIVASAGAGAIVGGIAAHGDAGFEDESLEELGVALKPSTSAVAISTSDKFLHAVRKQVSDEDMRTAVSDLSAQLLAKIENNLNVALGIELSEEGLLIQEVAVEEKLDNLIGIIAAKDGVIGDPTEPKDKTYFAPGPSEDKGVVGSSSGVTRQGNLPG